jgi:glycosyltransferase involved in cell wall biosynthesis
LHVAHIGFFNDPHDRQPEQLLQDWPTLGDVAECVNRAGLRVSVIQACRHSQHINRHGVGYHFLPFGGGRLTNIEHPFAALLRQLAPEVLHVHGLDFAPDVISLAAVAPQVPIVLQDHASRPPRPWRRSLWRRGCSHASAIAFCSLDQARPFKRLDLIPAATRIYAIPESSSHFTPGDQDQARCQSSVAGDPTLLWVGHLDTNKDPLTVLEGVSDAAKALPSLRMYCCYGSSPLLPEVQRRIAADPNLKERVHLLGAVPHHEIERLMRAADIFVLGSHREGSGYALIEAIACGLTPVVTDIPSFRELTGSGRVGALWPPGNASKLSESLQTMAAQCQVRRRTEVRSHFESELSFDVVGRKLASAYEDVLSEPHARLS